MPMSLKSTIISQIEQIAGEQDRDEFTLRGKP